MKLTDKQHEKLVDSLYEYAVIFSRRGPCMAELQDVARYVEQLMAEAYERGKCDGEAAEHERTWGAPSTACEHTMQLLDERGVVRCQSCDQQIEVP